LQVGARPTPEGLIELMVVVRLFDSSYQLVKQMTLDEYCVTLEGLDLCAKTAIHQIHQRELASADSGVLSSPRSASAPDADAAPSNGSTTDASKVPGVPTSTNATTSGSASAGISPAPIVPLR
jgi:hypothetical protein